VQLTTHYLIMLLKRGIPYEANKKLHGSYYYLQKEILLLVDIFFFSSFFYL